MKDLKETSGILLGKRNHPNADTFQFNLLLPSIFQSEQSLFLR